MCSVGLSLVIQKSNDIVGGGLTYQSCWAACTRLMNWPILVLSNPHLSAMIQAVRILLDVIFMVVSPSRMAFSSALLLSISVIFVPVEVNRKDVNCVTLPICKDTVFICIIGYCIVFVHKKTNLLYNLHIFEC